jgi:hypothetical protein
MLDAEHRMQIVVVLDDHTRAQLCGWNRHAENLSSLKLVTRCAPRIAGGALNAAESDGELYSLTFHSGGAPDGTTGHGKTKLAIQQ